MKFGSDFLMHIGRSVDDGAPIGSGRYRKGSGENPFQHEVSWMHTVREYRKKGMSDNEIAKAMGISSTEFRNRRNAEKAAESAMIDAEINRLIDLGWSNVAIGERVGHTESYVRNRRKAQVQERAQITLNTADILEKNIQIHKYVDVGEGVENLLGVSKQRLNGAVQSLIDKGYTYENIKVAQAAIPGQYTTIRVLAPPGTDKKDIYDNREEIRLPAQYKSDDGGRTFLGLEPPASVDSKRIQVRYAEDGGKDKDGVIELRRGVKDLSLGENNYAQVRIAVDGTHYLKGMAVYADKMPDGVDIIFNTNKTKDVPMIGPKDHSVLKPMKKDLDGNISKDNPFGSSIKIEDGQVVGQSHYTDSDGKSKLSAINIVREQADWDEWSRTLSSQFLSKQPIPLVQRQLGISLSRKQDEYDRIESITNPEIKRKALMDYAEGCDAAAVHLKSAALPRQSSKVILPLTDIKDNEVYAPTYENGEEVVLIRYPHGGTFEIPRLIVNNNVSSGKKIIGKDAVDAIGINAHVAERLSGADFDGDTVMVIPTKGQKIKTSDPLKGLVGFDPKEQYKGYEGMKPMSKKNTQKEMGIISNLITDMTLKGANDDEIARAVRHSMVVIDAEKHKLDYRRSYKDNKIDELKKLYQFHPETNKAGGASTLISLAGSETRVAPRYGHIDKETGAWVYTDKKDPGTHYHAKKRDSNGKVTEWEQVPNTIKSTKMAEASDAFVLSSGTKTENEYAKYANELKSLANKARKEAVNMEMTVRNPSAAIAYAPEVQSLKSKLNIALQNRPFERQAQIYTSVYVSNLRKSNPGLEESDIKKYKNQALNEGRRRFGASKSDRGIKITDKEWEAIQAGAMSSSLITKILENTDMDKVKEMAMPSDRTEIAPYQEAKIKKYLSFGYTLDEVAKAVGVSPSTVYRVSKGKKVDDGK